MRDLVLLAALLGITPLIFRAPIIGVLTWIWLSLMNPQREVYGFLAGFGLNFYVAAITIAAWAMSKERKLAPPNLATVALVAFGAWTCVTTYYALDVDYSAVLLDRTLKTIALCLVITLAATTKSRMQGVLWMIAVSLGYYAVKGGGFVVLTGGTHRVFGPDESMIEDNNSLGLALVMLLPLLNYLRVTSERLLVRLGLLAVMALNFVAIIGTYSRGALVALAAAIVVTALRSRSGAAMLVIGALIVGGLVQFMPDSWTERMASIQTYEEDASFAGRTAAWRTSVNIANERLLGGGFSAVDLDEVAERFYSPGALTDGRAAHSIYFQVIGDHGYIGLALYVLMLGAAVLNTVMVLGLTRDRPELDWANHLARALQVSMAAFLVGGAALSMAYYDGFLILLMLSGALLYVVRQPVRVASTTGAEPAWKQVAMPDAETQLGRKFRPRLSRSN